MEEQGDQELKRMLTGDSNMDDPVLKISGVPAGPIGVWIWGPTGSGKSAYVKERYPQARHWDMNSDLGTGQLVFDDPTPRTMKLLVAIIRHLREKGIEAPLVLVTSNVAIETCLGPEDAALFSVMKME
jgi:hypothetical protein